MRSSEQNATFALALERDIQEGRRAKLSTYSLATRDNEMETYEARKKIDESGFYYATF